MAVRLPSMHIAESVVNRILNIAAGLEIEAPNAVPQPMPPDAQFAGQQLDAGIAARAQNSPPVPGADTPAGQAATQAVLGGDTVLEGLTGAG